MMEILFVFLSIFLFVWKKVRKKIREVRFCLDKLNCRKNSHSLDFRYIYLYTI
jgi:hypothetical protein